jgi:phosphatidylinositol alpha-mannosyltransferase
LAARAAQLLDDPAARAELTIRGLARARVYDWSTVARDIVRVYETVAFDGTTARGRVWGR